MIVPQFWAESRVQFRGKGRQITIRRFGWSDTNESEAQTNADTRAREALDRVISGEKIRRREPKIAYNGAEGVPIREEIISRHGETIITRNSYGARCLNTPNVLFGDVDFNVREPFPASLLLIVLTLPVAFGLSRFFKPFPLAITISCITFLTADIIIRFAKRFSLSAREKQELASIRRIELFAAAYPLWSLRLYRTPAGLRILVTHRPFDPREPEVTEFFNAIGVDPLYARMCANQNCFRARVSAKPLRIGNLTHLAPRPGVWPISAEKRGQRVDWVSAYEQKARDFAACSYERSLGAGEIHREILPVLELHDQLCQATSGRPLA